MVKIMKKKILAPFIALLLVTGCDYNKDNFEGLDEMTKPSDIKSIAYTLTDVDYKAIADNAANKAIAEKNNQSAELAKLTANKYFAEPITADVYAPAFIAAKWYTADNRSAVKLTYNRGLPRPGYLGDIEKAENYTVTSADYASVWGATPATYFTPNKSAANNLPKILGNAIKEPTEGEYIQVSYQYSDKEPGGEAELVLSVLDETFDGVIKDKDIALDGWFNKDLSGTRNWQGKNYNSNNYAQVSGGGSGLNDSWLITPAIDLAEAVNPTLSFDICTGYYQGAKLQILISEDFNGADPLTASWVDITSYFYIPNFPSDSFGKLAPAGIMKLDNYRTKFYLAFRYTGDMGANPKVSATFQIDNLQVGDVLTVQENIAVKEDFQTIDATGKPAISLEGWINTNEKPWYGASYGTNRFAEMTAHNNGEVNSSLISKKMTVPVNGLLTFDVHSRYYKGDCLSVYISDDLATDPSIATWVDVTNLFSIPQESTDDFVSAGIISLKDYEGKEIAVKFTYIGSQSEDITTTIRIDNLKITTYKRIVSRADNISSTRYVGDVVERNAVYKYEGSVWNVADVSMVNPEDYELMGSSNNYFTSSMPADNYLPIYLSTKFPYAQEDDLKAVAYHYNNVTSIRVDEYIFKENKWVKSNNIEVVTDQFVLSNGEWNFNPSINLILVPGRNEAASKPYFQAIVDYVMEKPDFVQYMQIKTGDPGYYDNAEYYYGASYYQNNFDFRLSAWRTGLKGGEAVYEDYSDEELEALMLERLQEAFVPALEKLHGDMVLIDGVEITATIQFGVYRGTTISQCNYEIVYDLIDNGKFKYKEGSLKAL